MNIRVLNDRVLVLLPPNEDEQRTVSGLFVAHMLTPPVTYGRVVRVGPKVRDVREGDAVAFPATVGDECPMGEHRCLFLRESEIVATIQKRDVHEGVA